jgi:hypothetical protein
MTTLLFDGHQICAFRSTIPLLSMTERNSFHRQVMPNSFPYFLCAFRLSSAFEIRMYLVFIGLNSIFRLGMIISASCNFHGSSFMLDYNKIFFFAMG